MSETVTEEVKASTLLGSEELEVNNEESAEEKVSETTEAENKKLLEADDKTLKSEELAKKQELVKAQETTKAASVPEKYEFKAPEGVTLDTGLVEKVSPVLKELKITQEGAQKLMDAYAPYVKEQIAKQQEQAISDWNKAKDEWKQETLKELGNDAPKEMAFASKFINKFFDDPKAAREFLEETGIGNKNIIVKAFIKAGKSISADAFVEGTQTGGKTVDRYTHPDSTVFK